MKLVLCVVGLLVLSCVEVTAQRLSIAILGSPVVTVNTASAYQSGITVNNTTLKVTARNNTAWTLQVYATSANLTSGANTIPVSQVSMRAINTDCIVFPAFSLSTVNQLIAEDRILRAQDKVTNISIDYSLTGGATLLKPAGNYTTTLTFTATLQ